MTPTPVGMRCPDCAGQKTKVHTARSLVVEPRVTYALIAINVVVFLAQVLTEGGGRAEDGRVYTEAALFGPLVDQGEWWRIVSAGFLHGSPLHLVLNMVVLWFLGQSIEPLFGHLRFAAIYGASLVAGSFGALLLSPDSVTVGASGAVYGLIGALLMVYRDRGISITQSPIFGLLVINVLFTFFYPGISIGGHVGGFAGGALAALLVLQADRRRSTPLALAGCAAVAAVAVVGGIIAAGTPSLY
ncbi:MAG TPA: rhomboid family intramembrane serine protease [Solirubrobacteraceae bacterium]|nr:rhomboid family intramembrane serine protease [Solirubrobacteraceae bacterium]